MYVGYVVYLLASIKCKHQSCPLLSSKRCFVLPEFPRGGMGYYCCQSHFSRITPDLLIGYLLLTFVLPLGSYDSIQRLPSLSVTYLYKFGKLQQFVRFYSQQHNDETCLLNYIPNAKLGWQRITWMLIQTLGNEKKGNSNFLQNRVIEKKSVYDFRGANITGFIGIQRQFAMVQFCLKMLGNLWNYQPRLFKLVLLLMIIRQQKEKHKCSKIKFFKYPVVARELRRKACVTPPLLEGVKVRSRKHHKIVSHCFYNQQIFVLGRSKTGRHN